MQSARITKACAAILIAAFMAASPASAAKLQSMAHQTAPMAASDVGAPADMTPSPPVTYRCTVSCYDMSFFPQYQTTPLKISASIAASDFSMQLSWDKYYAANSHANANNAHGNEPKVCEINACEAANTDPYNRTQYTGLCPSITLSGPYIGVPSQTVDCTIPRPKHL